MADEWRGKKKRDTPLISGKMVVSRRNNSEEFIIVQNYLHISPEISVLVSNLAICIVDLQVRPAQTVACLCISHYQNTF